MVCSPDDGRHVTGEDDPVADPTQPNTVQQLIQAGRDREAARQGADVASRPNAHQPDGGSMDPLTQLTQLAPALGGVLASLTPDDLERPTACADFTVRGVLEHMVGGATAFAAAYRGTEPADPDLTDPLAALPGTLEDLFEAISAPGALDGMVQAPFGEVPRETFARFVVLDGLVHGWDMATAAGLPYDPPAELVAAVDAFAHEALDPLRDGQTFADAVEPSPDATPIDRLAAYTGRRALTGATP